MKTSNLFLMTGLLVGLVACGGNDEAAQNQTYYNPNDVYNVPNNPNNHNYQDTDQWMVQQLQGIYGNITVLSSAPALNLNSNQSISWKSLYDKLVQRANQSGCQTYSSDTSSSVLARMNLTCLRRYLNSNTFAKDLSSTRVRYNNDPGYSGYTLAHTVDQILSTFYSSYNYMYGSWSGYGYGYYPYTYTRYYGGGINVGVGYSSGGGLSIRVGGSFN